MIPVWYFFTYLAWQVFEFLFQNKYTADEDVDLEEVLIKKNSEFTVTPKKYRILLSSHLSTHIRQSLNQMKY